MKRGSPWLLLALAYVGFLSLGLPDGLLGVAWPEMRARFALPQGALGGLLATATAGYVTASFAAGWLLRRMRIGGLLALSCLATALSLLGYASAPAWLAVVAWGALAGLGAGAIDAGINAYVASHHSARTVNWLHACYGIGAAAGPALMSAVLMRGLGWERGYLLVGRRTARARRRLRRDLRALAAGRRACVGVGWRPGPARPCARPSRSPSARWSSAAFFVYVGIEASVGAWGYSLLALSRGFAMEVAAFWVSAFWVGLTAGRILAGAVAHALRAEAILRLALAGLLGGTTLVWLGPIRGSELVGLALVGLACGPIFPTLIATTPRRVGAGHAANAVGVQIAAAALGQSSLPAALGLLAGAFGLEVIGPCLVLAVVALALILGRVAAFDLRSARAEHALERPPHLRARPVEQDALIAVADPEQLADLVGIEPAHVAQRDDRPLGFGQRGDRALDLRQRLAVLQPRLGIAPLGRRVAPVSVLEEAVGLDRPLVFALLARQRRERHRARLARAARLGQVRGDREEPGAERAAPLEARQAVQHRDPRVLRDLLGERRAAHVGARDPDQRAVVAPHDLGVGGFLARAQARDELGVAIDARAPRVVRLCLMAWAPPRARSRTPRRAALRPSRRSARGAGRSPPGPRSGARPGPARCADPTP